MFLTCVCVCVCVWVRLCAVCCGCLIRRIVSIVVVLLLQLTKLEAGQASPRRPPFLLALPNQSFVSGPMSTEKRYGDGAATPRRSCAPSSETDCPQRMSKRTGRLNDASVIQFNNSTLTKSLWKGNVGVSRHFPHIRVI